MMKQAISVTLDAENLLWLRGQTHAAGARSISAMLDRLISRARMGEYELGAGARSVVGTIRVSDADPKLLGADAALRALFPPPVIGENAAGYLRSRKRPRARARRRRAR